MSPTRTRVRFDHDRAAAAERITAWGYPYPVAEADLTDAAVLRIDLGDRPAAYLWLHWATQRDDTLVLHACAAPDARGRWLSMKVVARLFAVAELMGAAFIGTQPTPDAPASLRRLYPRIGFTEIVPGVFLAPV